MMKPCLAVKEKLIHFPQKEAAQPISGVDRNEDFISPSIPNSFKPQQDFNDSQDDHSSLACFLLISGSAEHLLPLFHHLLPLLAPQSNPYSKRPPSHRLSADAKPLFWKDSGRLIQVPA